MPKTSLSSAPAGNENTSVYSCKNRSLDLCRNLQISLCGVVGRMSKQRRVPNAVEFLRREARTGVLGGVSTCGGRS